MWPAWQLTARKKGPRREGRNDFALSVALAVTSRYRCGMARPFITRPATSRSRVFDAPPDARCLAPAGDRPSARIEARRADRLAPLGAPGFRSPRDARRLPAPRTVGHLAPRPECGSPHRD